MQITALEFKLLKALEKKESAHSLSRALTQKNMNEAMLFKVQTLFLGINQCFTFPLQKRLRQKNKDQGKYLSLSHINSYYPVNAIFRFHITNFDIYFTNQGANDCVQKMSFVGEN